ncbi:5500_t:CDS:2, partial [Cetraspora pellucida]
DIKSISNEVLEAFQDIKQIASINPLFFEGTTVCSDQWLITFETTDDPELSIRIPRNTHINNHKVTTDWREAPKICFYYEKEGHIKKDCTELKALIEARKMLKEAKKLREKAESQTSNMLVEPRFSRNNSYISKITREEPKYKETEPLDSLNNTDSTIENMETDFLNEADISEQNQDMEENTPFTLVTHKKQKAKGKKKDQIKSDHPYRNTNSSIRERLLRKN